jgi:glycerophosphoryl diester phosphodiesterase
MAIEIDVRGTRDEELVVMHDDTVDRTTDGSGAVANMSLAELKRLDAGSWWGSEFAGERVPTLDETLDVVRDHGTAETTLILEMKTLDPGSVGKICRGLEERGLLGKTVGIGLIHLSVDVRRRFYAGSADFQCATVANVAGEIPTAVSDPYSSWIYARFPLSVDDVKAMHDGGKKVIASGPGVMDDVEVMAACAEAGADTIMAYHPVALEQRLGR